MDEAFPPKDPHLFGKAPPPPKYKKRRRIDPNEDTKAIKKVLKDIAEQDVTLEDLLLLVSPHTGDKGAALNKVMTEDIAAFRKMVVKIYDTMTQDVSDVLANEQMDLARMYAEKQRIALHKMERALQDMHDICPDFDFREYYKDPEKYLATVFKVAEMPDDEEVETARKQLTYHRLQWLQSEGERLQAENKKLQQHLSELKKIQREEIVATVQKEQEEEQKKAELERQQAEMLNQLEQLNTQLHDAIVGDEKKKVAAKKKGEKKAMKKSRTSIREKLPWQASGAEEEWKVQAAGAVESTIVQASQVTVKSAGRVATGSRPGPSRFSTFRAEASAAAAAAAAAPTTATAPPPPSATGAVPRKSAAKKKKAPAKPRPVWQDVDLEEFGVGTAPAEDVPAEVFRRPSPPQRSSPPPTRQAPPAAACPDTCASAAEPTGRRVRGPRDTWGGFY